MYKTMTPKHMISLDNSVIEIMPCGTTCSLMTEDAGPASPCDRVGQSVGFVNSSTSSQGKCIFQNTSTTGTNVSGDPQSNGVDFNSDERNCARLTKENPETSLLRLVETCEAVSREIELLKIVDTDKSTDGAHSAGCHRITSVNNSCLVPGVEPELDETSEQHFDESSSTPCEVDQDGCASPLNIFDSLPLELQHKVLSYLTPSQLCRSVAPVCRRWHGLAYEPILWQHLTFTESVPCDAVKKILQRSTLVRYCSLFGFSEVGIFLPHLANCHFLLCLDFKMCGGLFAEGLSLLVQHCPLVESLNVEGCRNIDNAAVAEIVGWKRMRSLNLSHCTCVQDESVVLLAQAFTRLEELNIDGIENISDAAVTVVVDQRKGTLQKLLLDGEDLTDVTYRSLSSCTGLNELCVSFAVLMSDQGLVAIKELAGLRNLKIKRGSELSESGLQALFESQNLCHLTSLDLSGCSNLEDAGVDAMTKCCSKLQFLGLEWCWDISDKGLELIVTRCSCLKVINLVGLVKITGSCFAKIPESMPHLTYLDLQQCSRIIDDIVEDVVRRKPDLKVLDYYGEELLTDVVNGVTTQNKDKSDVCVCGQHLEL